MAVYLCRKLTRNFRQRKLPVSKNLAYHELAFEIISPYVGDSIPEQDLHKILRETYSKKNFFHPEIAPLKKLSDNHYLLELFHGPTLAFKDFALQLLGHFFEYFTAGQNHKINILAATSGDTGSAAIAGCAGLKNVNIFILHPHGKVSEVQRRQMTTINSHNVFNIALQGTFDDCQNTVKDIFSNLTFKLKHHLTAVNSINWARIVAQIVYYFYAALKLGAPDKKVSFSVPSGNFGDILAGYIAQRMGLPIEKLLIATNDNDILHRFIQNGIYKKQIVSETLAPSMDIQISSNFERLLFEYNGRNSDVIINQIKQLNDKAQFIVEDSILVSIKELFSSSKSTDDEIIKAIKVCYDQTKEIIDPHTATGYRGSLEQKNTTPIITLATAHPAKFPDAVKKAIGKTPELAKQLANIYDLAENYRIIGNEMDLIKQLIEKTNR